MNKKPKLLQDITQILELTEQESNYYTEKYKSYTINIARDSEYRHFNCFYSL